MPLLDPPIADLLPPVPEDTDAGALRARISALVDGPVSGEVDGVEAEDAAQDGGADDALARLDAAARLLFTWHDAHRDRPEHPWQTAIGGALDAIQAAHREEVARGVAEGRRVWTPHRADLSPAESAGLDELWRALRGEAPSALTVHEETLGGVAEEPVERVAGFRTEVDALHARILAGPAGRALLRAVVSAPRAIHVRPAHPDDGHDTAYAAPGLHHPPDAETERAWDAAALAVEDASDPRGWRPAEGIEARVVLRRGLRDSALRHRDASGTDLDWASGHPVLTPAFVAYAHELGHALNLVRGEKKTALRRPEYDRDRLPAERMATREALGTGRVAAADELRFLWRTMEEHDVVERVENAVRAEWGLTPRRWH